MARRDPRIALLGRSAAEEIADASIRHLVFLQRLSNQERNQIIGFINRQVLPDLTAKLTVHLERIRGRGVDSNVFRTAALKRMIRAFSSGLQDGMNDALGLLVKDLRELGQMESAVALKHIKSAMPIDFALVAPNLPEIHSAITSRPMQGALLRDWWRGVGRSAQLSFERQLTIGLAEGESTVDIVRRIRGIPGGAPGVYGTLRRNTEAIVRTAINHVSTQAREITYLANNDLIKSVMIVATLDARTTDICISLDGKVFEVMEGPRPPFHMQCRTTTTPVLKSFEELGLRRVDFPASTRASMNGQVPSSVTYPEWLKGQPAAFQNEVLGPTRARLFRQGKVAGDRFVNNQRQTLTLEQLRRREGLTLEDIEVVRATGSVA